MQLACPAAAIWITPAQGHISFELLFSIGILPSMMVGASTIHRPVGTGTHGIGVYAQRSGSGGD